MRLVLLGDPVAHSLSPAIQRAALAATGVDGSYEARRVDVAGLRTALDEIRYGMLRGGNVTMPHKQEAFAGCDQRSAEAMQTGAVNTIVGAAGTIVGHNTDVAGIRYAAERAALPARSVLVLGAGGAAAAAVVAFADREVAIAARRPDAVRLLLERTRAAARVVPWAEPVPDAVVVNATALGMHGEELPPGIVEHAAGLLEMPYAAGTTPAEAKARALGLPVAPGVDMLIGQAMASFTIWTGVDAPETAMRAAAERARGSQGAG